MVNGGWEAFQIEVTSGQVRSQVAKGYNSWQLDEPS
jgi:hypothetical protein